MRNSVVLSIGRAMAAVALTAGLAFGASWFSHNSSVKSTNVDIVYNTTLPKGVVLQSGSYRMEIPLNTQTPDVKFFQNGKLVATVPAKVKPEGQKSSATEIDYDKRGSAHFMTRAQIQGLNEALVFSNAGRMKSGS